MTLAVCERRGIAGHLWQQHRQHIAPRSRRPTAFSPSSCSATALSGDARAAYGQQRLLEIALALATKPKVLLLDEPAAGVPHDESGELFEAVASLSDDITVLFIEHDMDVVFRFATRSS